MSRNVTNARLAVVLEQRFRRSDDGAVWTTMAFGHEFWERYLACFVGVEVVARVQRVASPPLDAVRADGPNVRFIDVPHFVGPREYLSTARRVNATVVGAVTGSQPVMLRVPGLLGTIASRALVKYGKPFGIEVVGDPLDVFAPGALKHPFRALFRQLFWSQLRYQCAKADVVAYVTESALQRRYPPGQEAYVAHYSSIQLEEDAFSQRLQTPRRDAHRLITIGSLQHDYKGVDVLIKALAHCRGNGLRVALDVIGDGAQRPALERLSRNLRVEDAVRFRGLLAPGVPVREALKSADVFVLASRTEGLPRAMIEAMAVGLPCIGTRVGGIPELLPDEALVDPNRPDQLAAKLHEVLGNCRMMQNLSSSNYRRARGFHAEALGPRRLRTYDALAGKTAAWLDMGGAE